MPLSTPSTRADTALEDWSLARSALAEADPERKCRLVDELAERIASGQWAPRDPGPPGLLPSGRPGRPRLISPRDLPRRRLGTVEGRIALVHAIAHIEFNAINLGLDAALRFDGMPDEYYRDWLRVAHDEARHFRMLRERLIELGSDYGELDAHNGLWDMAEKTAHDVLVRMALVPRVLEARGLDVTPGMIDRLRQVDDSKTVALLEVILEEEEAHVAIGSRWFRHCCQERGVDPDPTFESLLKQYFADQLRGPFNLPARRRAGFTEPELDRLQALGS
ncbi:ferritin-like domain-containing protein [Wenzhouxiangella sp. AB-CW3]|uniref:ferritin-like domain-containing protein n=1 Tax=Wenzhouxiangella sp. AB-CW3 TaxID=2771012 RepID=UPI00168A9083|nr:ferritin-like domain-containing protein [Wenzhouxiangella sp. AB-CW3]QOC21638.1 ferritin-like domain-containing protein [Wenzhouxiangella sp. AB-CW3]